MLKVNILQLQINTKQVFLNGISLKGDFTLSNPNQYFALNFEIDILQRQQQKSQKMENKQEILSIFPQKGLIMKMEQQKILIKVKLKQGDKQEFKQEQKLLLLIKYNLRNNFNKILIKNKQVKGVNVEQLQKLEGEFFVSVEVGTNHMKIIQQIQNEVQFQSSIGPQSNNISQIVQKNKQIDNLKQTQEQDLNDVCDILNSLQLSSKIKSKLQIKRNSSLPQKQVIMTQEKNENLSKKQIKMQSIKNQQISLGLESANDKSFTKTATKQFQSFGLHQFSSILRSKTAIVYANSLQILILATLAGLCYSLGSFFGKYFTP